MSKGKKIGMYLFLIIFSLLSIFPLYYMVCAATNMSVDVIRGKLIPGTYFLENYKTLIANQNLYRALWNSFRNSAVLTALCLLICSLAGYGFEIYHTKAKDIVLTILLTAMMVPFAAIMIDVPDVLQTQDGQYDGGIHASVYLDSVYDHDVPSGVPFLPEGYYRGGRMDGLSEIGIFFRMFIPTMKSTYSAALIITFMNAWNNYMWPKIILQTNESITMPMLVSNLLSGYTVDYGMLMLGVLICTVPTAIVFFFFQKSFTEGITGAVK